MGPTLTQLDIGDRPDAWERAGFRVVDRRVRIGPVTIVLEPPAEGATRGVLAWAFDGVDHDESIDGLLTLDRPLDAHDDAIPHPNGVTGVDHVVVMTDDLDRTSTALRHVGFEPRRRRDLPDADPPRAQIFWWAGPTIIELVGPVTATGTGPASIWGLALTVDDIDRTANALGERMSAPKAAVQPGRRIAALRTRDLDISVPIALMTPHVAPPD
jgi:hypothetical protein